MTFDDELGMIGSEAEYELFDAIGIEGATVGAGEVGYAAAGDGAVVVGESVFPSTVPILAADGASLGVFTTATCGWFVLGGFVGVGLCCLVVYGFTHDVAPDSWSRYPPFHPLRKRYDGGVHVFGASILCD